MELHLRYNVSRRPCVQPGRCVSLFATSHQLGTYAQLLSMGRRGGEEKPFVRGPDSARHNHRLCPSNLHHLYKPGVSIAAFDSPSTAKVLAMFQGMNIIEFGKRFQTNADCFQYLMDVKWDSGFKCCKCGSLKYWKGKQWTNLRRQACGYEESATAGTLFHKIKFPLLKAFHICYRVCVSKRGCQVVSCPVSCHCVRKPVGRLKERYRRQ